MRASSASSVINVIRRVRYGVPQWAHEISAAQARARTRLASAVVDGETWYWPADETFDPGETGDEVRLLAPFDPVVWDRRKFEALWGWPYRFEAYTPVNKRKLGYYALPMLWREHVIGWANVSGRDGEVEISAGYAQDRRPRSRQYRVELDAELDRLRAFLARATS